MPARIRAEDLPPEVRRKLVGRAARPAPARTRPTIDDDDDLPPRWRCRGCGKRFTAWAAAQRHAGAPEHRRIELDLGGER